MANPFQDIAETLRGTVKPAVDPLMSIILGAVDSLGERAGGVIAGISTLTGNIVDTVTGGIFNREGTVETATDREQGEQVAAITPPRQDAPNTVLPLSALGDQARIAIQSIQSLATVTMDTQSPEFQVSGTQSFAHINSFAPQAGAPALVQEPGITRTT